MGVSGMIEVLEGGIQTTVQDFPGREGLLDQGICPAGPFDNLAFRLDRASCERGERHREFLAALAQGCDCAFDRLGGFGLEPEAKGQDAMRRIGVRHQSDVADETT